MENMEALSAFYLAGKVQDIKIETLEISHPGFSQTWYLVRNVAAGVTVTHEDGKDYFHQYYPLQIQGGGARDDLDFELSINLGDLNEIIREEMQNLLAVDGFDIKPRVIYRAYRSDTMQMIEGPLELEADEMAWNNEGSTFTAGAPETSRAGTGRIYDFDTFPSLRALI